jgi:hypothetical protein
MTEPFPDKPKGMHWKTYRRLFQDYERTNREYTRLMLVHLQRLTGRVLKDLGGSR